MKKKKKEIDIYYQELLDAIQCNTEVDWQEDAIIKALDSYIAALHQHYNSMISENYSLEDTTPTTRGD